MKSYHNFNFDPFFRYDFGDVPPSSSENSPPPLPNRLLGSGKGSAFQKVNNTSNVIISGSGGSVLSNVTINGHNSSSNNSTTSSPSIYQHPPPPKQVCTLWFDNIYNFNAWIMSYSKCWNWRRILKLESNLETLFSFNFQLKKTATIFCFLGHH